MKFEYCSCYALYPTNLTISSLTISFNQNPQINLFKFKLLVPILVLNGKKVAPGLGYNFPPLTLLPNTEELIGPDTSTLYACAWSCLAHSALVMTIAALHTSHITSHRNQQSASFLRRFVAVALHERFGQLTSSPL